MITTTIAFAQEHTPVIRYIKDPIHDHIPISEKLARFIDTKQFQRLRHVKQLGTTMWVWPGASHSRFEHCLGVAYLARLTATHLQSSQPELGITDRDIDCIEIAGLCHDLGHGPWSHLWDGTFIPLALPGSTWKHEQGSEMMFDALVKENNIPISQADQDFIKALIAGLHLRTPHEKAFLFDIVANQRNGLDVDKVDYILRDSHMVGEPINLSSVRLIHSTRVNDDQICYNIKDANLIYELYNARFRLHKMIYHHKTGKAIEYMIVDGLLAAEPYEKIAERIFDPKRFLYLTDDIMAHIQSSEEPKLEAARRIFDRIDKRDLYKCVDYKVIDWPDKDIFRTNVTCTKIFESALALCSTPNAPFLEHRDDALSELQVSDIIVDFSTMHYGKMEKNPLNFVQFYSKNDPNHSRDVGGGCYSNLMPQYFAEVLLRVFAKKTKFAEIIQAGYRKILTTMQEEYDLKMSKPFLDREDVYPGMEVEEQTVREGSASAVPTPPATEAPTTPKGTASGLHSRNTSFTAGVGPTGGSAVLLSTPLTNNAFMDFPRSRNASSSPSRTLTDPERQVPKVVQRRESISPTPGPSTKRKRAESQEPQAIKRKSRRRK